MSVPVFPLNETDVAQLVHLARLAGSAHILKSADAKAAFVECLGYDPDDAMHALVRSLGFDPAAPGVSGAHAFLTVLAKFASRAGALSTCIVRTPPAAREPGKRAMDECLEMLSDVLRIAGFDPAAVFARSNALAKQFAAQFKQ